MSFVQNQAIPICWDEQGWANPSMNLALFLKLASDSIQSFVSHIIRRLAILPVEVKHQPAPHLEVGFAA